MQIEAGGHGFSVGREIKGLSDLLEKTGNIKSVASEAAQNTLTNAQEFSWGDVFMNFSYQNKGGKLFANGRQLESINDVNEIGGDRMGRVIDALNHMITDRNIDESIVVSEDLGYGRHFIYRYRKGSCDNIEGLAFEFQGNKEELSGVVNRLGKRAVKNSEADSRNLSDFAKPLFFTKDNKNDITDLSKAALDSFRTKERKSEMGLYINRLKRDTENYEGLKHRRQQQKEELEKLYEKLILSDGNAKTGIANAVYGMIDKTERMVVSEGRRREEAVKINIVTQHLLDPDSIKQDKICSLPGTIDHTGEEIVANDINWVNPENDNNTNIKKINETKTSSREQIVRQVVEPFVPGIIGLLPVVGSIQQGNSNPFLSDEDAYNIRNEPVKLFNGIFTSYSLQESKIWQEFISSIFEPMTDFGYFSDRQIAPLISKEQDFHTYISEFIYTGGNTHFPDNKRSHKEALTQFFLMLDAEKKDKFQPIQDKEGLPELTTVLQQGLEVISAILKKDESKELTNGQKEEKTIQHEIEKEAVSLGEEIIAAIFAYGKIPQYDVFTKLAFLLFSYKDENSSEEIKQIISTLIYRQIELIFNDKTSITRLPQLESVFEKFQKLFLQAKSSNGRSIYQSFEKLRHHHLNGVTHLLFRNPHKNKVKKLIKKGIIYFHPTCFIEYIYDKI